MSTIIKHRRGTSLALITANPVLAAGELCFDTTANLFKIGDGTTPWVDLPFVQNPIKNESISTAQIKPGGVDLSRLKVATTASVVGSTGGSQWPSFIPWTEYFRGLLNVGTGTAACGYLQARQQPGADWKSSTIANQEWRGVAYGNGLFVAVAQTGTNRAATSVDGSLWTLRATAANGNAWTAVTFGAGVFVAAASSGASERLMYSADGVTWSLATVPSAAATATWSAVTYGDGRFVAVSSNGFIVWSTNGKTWTSGTPPAANITWRTVTYGRGLFVALADTGATRLASSPDGVTWTARTPSRTAPWNISAYGNGLFVAYGGSGFSMTSTDGISWTNPSYNGRPLEPSALTYGSGVFVMVGAEVYATLSISLSANPATESGFWRTATNVNVAANGFKAVCYGNGMFVAVGTGIVFTSGSVEPATTADIDASAFSRELLRVTTAGEYRTALDVYSTAEVDAEIAAKGVEDGDKGDVTVTNSGQTWTVNSTPNVVIDALTFNGTQTTFNLAADGIPFTPLNAASVLISLNGVIQQPGTAYTVSGSTITFAAAPAALDSFFGVYLNGTGSGGYPQQRVYVQTTQPTAAGPYLWIDTSDGDFQFWIETGE